MYGKQHKKQWYWGVYTSGMAIYAAQMGINFRQSSTVSRDCMHYLFQVMQEWWPIRA